MAARDRTSLAFGADSGLETVWDEVCVQVQFQESLLWWDGYVPTIVRFIEEAVAELPRRDQVAIWLGTDAGFDWLFDAQFESRFDEAIPAADDEICDFIFSKVLGAAGDWRNGRIEAYLSRHRDWG